MQLEDMDHRIREAAENHHPAYNEKAWPEMEKLLNKHLPVEKKRRRRFLIWWLLPLLAGGSYLLYTQLQQKGKGIDGITSTQQSGVKANQPAGKPGTDQSATPVSRDNEPVPPVNSNNPGPATGKPDATATNASSPGTANPAAPENGSNSVPAQPSSPAGNTDQQVRSVEPKNPAIAIAVQNGNIGKKKRNASAPTGEKKPANLPVNNILPDQIKQPSEPVNARVQPAAEKKQEPASPVAADPVISETAKANPEPANATAENNTDKNKPSETADSAKTIQKNTTAIKVPKKKAKSTLFLAISAGPDLSFVSAERPGTTKLVTGLGLGYQYKDRLTLRTGFYTARKVYTAGPNSYNTPPAFNQYYPYLEKVDANCKVYEIPVAVSYHFGRKQARSYFVSGGLSTLLMKEETYKYYYKYTPQGRIYTNQWTINNENKHFFSVLTLSGGYQRSFGKRVSLIAEPYLKLPLGGVGYGRVKLNSGGVLFTAGIKLF